MPTFQNDPNLPNYCPDPVVVINDAILAIASEMKTQLCNNSKFTTDQVALLQGQIDALTGSENLASQISELQALINTLDTDGDGALSELTGINTIANQALTLAQQAKDESASAAATATQLGQDLATFQTSVNNQLASQATTIQGISDSVSSMQQSITDANAAATSAQNKGDQNALALQQLQQQVNDLPDSTITAEDQAAVECAVYAKVAEAFNVGVTAALAKLQEACPVDDGGNNGGGNQVL